MGCTDQLEPSQRQAALDAAGQSIVEHLKREAVLERLVESRFGSLERLVAMQVMFYHMAARVAAFWYVQHASAVCGFQPTCLIVTLHPHLCKVQSDPASTLVAKPSFDDFRGSSKSRSVPLQQNLCLSW